MQQISVSGCLRNMTQMTAVNIFPHIRRKNINTRLFISYQLGYSSSCNNTCSTQRWCLVALGDTEVKLLAHFCHILTTGVGSLLFQISTKDAPQCKTKTFLRACHRQTVKAMAGWKPQRYRNATDQQGVGDHILFFCHCRTPYPVREHKYETQLLAATALLS